MAEIITRLTAGTNPSGLSLSEVKLHLKIDETLDNALITSLIDAAIDFASDYTGRQYRTGATWQLLSDELDDRVIVRRSPVSAVSEVARKVNGSWVAVSASTYYLKTAEPFDEIVLKSTATWPDDVDDIEQGWRVLFTTGAHAPSIGQAKIGILRLIAAAYDDRGDYESLTGGGGAAGNFSLAALNDLARKSGAAQFFASHRVARI